MQKSLAFYPARNPPGTISRHHDHEYSADQEDSLNCSMRIQVTPIEEGEQWNGYCHTDDEGQEIEHNGCRHNESPAYLGEPRFHAHYLLSHTRYLEIHGSRWPFLLP